MTTTTRDHTRTRTQWTLGLMALVPTISGAQQVLLGALSAFGGELEGLKRPAKSVNSSEQPF